jgi:ABC-type multidrug transport system ATPase subunit
MSKCLQINLEQAGKRYNRDWIFKGCSFNIPSGSKLAITGANGSGKSTLLQCLCGYQPLSAGQINYQIENDVIPIEQLYKYIALATPYLELPEAYSLEEMIAFHFSLKSRKADFDLTKVLYDSGLEAHKRKSVMYFSSGMKQRLKLLLAFGSDVPVLFLDEPTTNLDKAGIAWYNELTRSLEAYPNQTIIIASNQPYEYHCCTAELAIEHFK